MRPPPTPVGRRLTQEMPVAIAPAQVASEMRALLDRYVQDDEDAGRTDNGLYREARRLLDRLNGKDDA